MSKRILRVNELLKKEINDLLLKEIDLSNDIFVTITDVKTSPNLQEAKIYISVFPENKQNEVLNEIKKNIYFLQQKLNQRLKMKILPRLLFLSDLTIQKAGELEKIFAILKKKDK